MIFEIKYNPQNEIVFRIYFQVTSAFDGLKINKTLQKYLKYLSYFLFYLLIYLV